MKKFLFTVATLVSMTSPAFAQSEACAPHEQVVEHLAEVYGETRQSIGLASDNNVIEIFASLETGSWTITVTSPGGPTCIVADGFSFQHTDEDLPKEGEDA